MNTQETTAGWVHGLRLGAALLGAVLGAWLSVDQGGVSAAGAQGLASPPVLMPAFLILDGEPASDEAAPVPQAIPVMPQAKPVGEDTT